MVTYKLVKKMLLNIPMLFLFLRVWIPFKLSWLRLPGVESFVGTWRRLFCWQSDRCFWVPN